MGKKNETKQLLFLTAAKLFYQHGYKKTTIRMIAQESGFAHVSFLYYYENKAELGAQIIDHYLRWLVGQTMLFIEQNDISENDSLSRFLFYWTTHFYYLKTDELFGRFYREFSNDESEAFYRVTAKYANPVFTDIFHLQYNRSEEELRIDFILLNSIDATLSRLCSQGDLSVSGAVEKLLEMNVVAGYGKTISKDEIDRFIKKYCFPMIGSSKGIYQRFIDEGINPVLNA
ncbi:MAG: TetR/AcrR family transcriptional regulator [Anaerofustis sp.]